MNRILLVDDEEAVCWALQRALGKEGYKVEAASSAEDAFSRCEKNPPDTIVLDVHLPGVDGLSAMERLKILSDEAPIVVITAHGNLSTAVRAVENGAFEYLAKPFDLDQALEIIQRALQRRAQQLEGKSSSDEVSSIPIKPPEEIVGHSAAMQNVFKRVALVAPREACVLITGESGTGKELIARAIHRHSKRRDGPFLPVHIAALNPGLVESELFGHEKGSFTGATQSRPGLFSLAEGGTLFLDELADIPISVQGKLLRVLEHGEVMAVGGKQGRPLDVRILAATHQDLHQKVAEGTFRHDLFFRLNVFQIHLPPLRERPGDIVFLAEHFLTQLEPQSLPLPQETIEFLQTQPWLGNVRELRNALEHAVIVSRSGPLLPQHFPAPIVSGGNSLPGKDLQEAVRHWVDHAIRNRKTDKPSDLYEELLQCVEPVLLEEVLRRLQGNRLVAAQWLGLNRATVRKKLGQYGLTDAFRGNEADQNFE